MADVKLQGCPFCGESDGVACTWAIASDDHYVECDKCEISGPRKDTQLEAIAAWNTRPAPALTPKQAAADEMFDALTTALAAEQTRLYSLPPSDDYETSVAKDGCSARIGKYRAALAKAGQP